MSKSKPDAELAAIRGISRILAGLSPSARGRVLRFASERALDEAAQDAAPLAVQAERGLGGALARAAQAAGNLL